jgi:hypothetical protein
MSSTDECHRAVRTPRSPRRARGAASPASRPLRACQSHKPEYVARRGALQEVLAVLAPEASPNIELAGRVLPFCSGREHRHACCCRSRQGGSIPRPHHDRSIRHGYAVAGERGRSVNLHTVASRSDSATPTDPGVEHLRVQGLRQWGLQIKDARARGSRASGDRSPAPQEQRSSNRWLGARRLPLRPTDSCARPRRRVRRRTRKARGQHRAGVRPQRVEVDEGEGRPGERALRLCVAQHACGRRSRQALSARPRCLGRLSRRYSETGTHLRFGTDECAFDQNPDA